MAEAEIPIKKPGVIEANNDKESFLRSLRQPGSRGHSLAVTVDPWLCVPGFRRVCLYRLLFPTLRAVCSKPCRKRWSRSARGLFDRDRGSAAGCLAITGSCPADELVLRRIKAVDSLDRGAHPADLVPGRFVERIAGVAHVRQIVFQAAHARFCRADMIDIHDQVTDVQTADRQLLVDLAPGILHVERLLQDIPREFFTCHHHSPPFAL